MGKERCDVSEGGGGWPIIESYVFFSEERNLAYN